MTKKTLKEDLSPSEGIKTIALKHYKQYVSHYKSKNLDPMPFSDFLKNYKN